MIDFTSSLYLGMKHSSRELTGWDQLTPGVPAALQEPVIGKDVANTIAKMQGLDSGLLAPSTLHLFFDLYGLLSRLKVTLFIDEEIYPVSLYGVERSIISRKNVFRFHHLDAGNIAVMVNRFLDKSGIPVILTDGWCTRCGKTASIDTYMSIVKPAGGWVIVDDTQAFGILGKREDAFNTYGKGGGGILKWMNVSGENIITLTSLAKGFGVPVAAICGSQPFIKKFALYSETRVNSSQTNFAVLNAAVNALRQNSKNGDQIRKKLLQNILYLKRNMHRLNIDILGNQFPAQFIRYLTNQKVSDLYYYLLFNKIKTVMVAPHLDQMPAMCINITADHTEDDIDQLIKVVWNFLKKGIKHQPTYENIAD